MHPLWILLTLLPVFGAAERFNCKGRILGAYYADAKSGCKAFHVCVRVAGGGIRDFRFFCPPGTLFHQEAQTCTDWGDDDPLACPADIYDGQFDLYRIGSGYDTRKLSSTNREDEPEFGLQRAETGDHRLSQNNVASNSQASDLRAAHSSDFFTGQRDRGRDDSALPQQPSQQPQATRAQPSKPVQNSPRIQPVQPTSQAPRAQKISSQQLPAQPRQSFRRATTPRTPSTTAKYSAVPSLAPESSNPVQYEFASKRKLVRKRPIYSTSPIPPVTFPPNTPPPYSQAPQQQFNKRIPSPNRQTLTTPNVPPQFKEYKDEYVEVSRVTPKPNKFFPSNPSSTPFYQSTPVASSNKKEGLIELYNYESQSTAGFNVQNDNRQFNARNSFSVSDVPRENDFVRTKNLNNNFNGARNIPTTTADYNTVTRGPTSTQTYKNFNSVSYEPEKNNFVPYSKQNNFFNNNPTTTQTTTTTFYTTLRPELPAHLNTVAYNTNNAFSAQTSNYAEEEEDDGQYRPPQGEDDGQYRPELYDRELLSGAHSLNIAASGNRLPEDQKPHRKPRPPKISQTVAPRPFRPAPVLNTSTTRAPELTITTTNLPQTTNGHRTFDLFQTYTTTSRPTEFLEGENFFGGNNGAKITTTTVIPRIIETRPTRPQTHPTPPPTFPPKTFPSSSRPTTRRPSYANPPNREDTSYDYAYYDSDPGFSEYDHLEEFGRTKKRA